MDKGIRRLDVNKKATAKRRQEPVWYLSLLYLIYIHAIYQGHATRKFKQKYSETSKCCIVCYHFSVKTVCVS